MGGSINGSAAFDFSGSAISMSQDGTRVAIGASLSDGTGKTNDGHVRVFGWDSGSSSWDQVGADIDGEDDLDEDSALGVEVQRRGITVECCQYEVDRSFECVPGARLLCSASSPPPLYAPACRL